MSRKIYEHQHRDQCRLLLNYLGNNVKVDFTGGNLRNNVKARFVTDSQFIQDALETDDRFGIGYKLVDEFKTDEEIAAEKAEAEAASQKESKKKSKGSKTTTTEVADIKTLNDAIDYFAAKGEAVMSADDVQALCEKYNVSFPDFKG